MYRDFRTIDEVNDFGLYLRHKRRYVLDKEWVDLIDTIAETAKKRILSISKEIMFYRARSKYNKDKETAVPLPIEKMCAPPLEDSEDGRVNPVGIPCLYLANSEKTAIAELRPWLGMKGSIATFSLQQNVKVVDATINSMNDVIAITIESKEKQEILKDAEAKEKANWGWIDNMFSLPVSPHETMPAYACTQYLAEVFKNLGCDGIKYRSSTNREDGYNLALFDRSIAKPIVSRLFEVTDIYLSFNIK